MKEPIIPWNETERLAELERYKILDTLPEQEYDEFVKLAAQICDTPIALISLIDKNRQWFKAKVGIDATETPRNISFCGHAVAEQSTLIVSDTLKDNRFADNPLVVGSPKIRFYMGVPLTTINGYSLGTLCVIDTQPKQLTIKQIQELEILSRLLMNHLELRRKSNKSQLLATEYLQESNQRYATLAATVPVGILHINSEGKCLYLNDYWCKMAGVSPDFAIRNQWQIFIHPEDRDAVNTKWQQALKNKEPWVAEFRMQRCDGSIIFVYAQFEPENKLDEQDINFIGSITDLSDRRKIENDLRETKELLEEAQKIARLGSWELNFPTNHLSWSPEVFRVFELDPLEFEAGTLASLNLVAPEDREAINSAYTKHLTDNVPFNIIYRLLMPDGRVKYVQEQCETEYGKNGLPLKSKGTIQDITEYQKTKLALESLNQELEERVKFRTKQLRQQDALLQDFLDNANDLIQSVRLVDGSFEYINKSWLKTLGYSQAGITKLTIFDILAPEYHEHCQNLISQIQSNDVYEFQRLELAFLTKDRQKIWVEGSINSRFVKGKPIATRGIFRDITQQKQAQTELAASKLQLENLNERLQLATKSAKIGVWDWNILEDKLTWDERMYQIYGRETSQFAGRFQTWEQTWHPEDAPYTKELLEQALKGERKFETIFRIVCPDGEIRWIEAHAIVQRNERGEAQRVIGTNTNISDRKEAEFQLQRTNMELARANRLKDEFLANMSHELRTPLNAILGMSEILLYKLQGEINEQQEDSIKIIYESGNDLLQLIEDILELTKIESQPMELQYQQTQVQQLCESSLVFIKQQALKKRIKIQVKITPNLPELIIDERRIRKVLINLLNNAVKFTENEGTITLEVTLKQNPNIQLSSSQISNRWINFSVIDTGIGISQENIHKLFQPFVQLDGALNRKYSGTGLGLCLVKQIVELHEGKVGVKSQEGVGSHFWFDLPCDLKSVGF